MLLKRIYCTKCELSFTYISQLKIHSRIHTGEKPFKCDKCGRCFKRLQQCKVHISLGHSQNKIICPELNCGKFFGTNANLIRHQLAFHLNLKRWICGFCSHSFAQSQDLRKHLSKCHHYQMKTILYKEKKSMEEVYIIPEPSNDTLSEDNYKKIFEVHGEEKLKLTLYNQRNYLKKNGSTEPQKGKIPILISENYSDCALCKASPVDGRLHVCRVCSENFCSLSHLDCHTLEKHPPLLYQCYFCKILFRDNLSCGEHIQKFHKSNIYSQNPVLLSEFACNYPTPLVSNFSCLSNPPIISVPVISSENLQLLQVPSNIVPPITFQSDVVEPTIKHVFKTVPINSNLRLTAQSSWNKNWDTTIICSDEVILPHNALATSSLDIQNSNLSNFSASLSKNNICNNLQVIDLGIEVPLEETCENVTTQNRLSEENLLEDDKVYLISLRNRPIKVQSIGKVQQSSISLLKTPRKRKKTIISVASLKCETCSKEFPCHNSLKRHKKIHEVHKYTCNICGKTFAEKYNLKTHDLMHTKDTPRCCHLCGKKFRYARDLKDHLYSHEGLLPFSCHECDARFLRKRDLHRHNKEQHLRVKYSCKVCGLSFKRKDYLEKMHMNTHLNCETVSAS